MNIRRFTSVTILALGLSSLALPALADDAQFPMQASAFKEKVDARLAKARARMEERLAQKQAPAEKVQEVRTRFEESAQKLSAEVAKACADGVVTQDEAQAVRSVAHELRRHHRGAHARAHGQGHGRGHREAKGHADGGAHDGVKR